MENFEDLFHVKRRQMEELISILSDRAQIEEDYSKDIGRIANRLAILSDQMYIALIFIKLVALLLAF